MPCVLNFLQNDNDSLIGEFIAFTEIGSVVGCRLLPIVVIAVVRFTWYLVMIGVALLTRRVGTEGPSVQVQGALGFLQFPGLKIYTLTPEIIPYSWTCIAERTFSKTIFNLGALQD